MGGGQKLVVIYPGEMKMKWWIYEFHILLWLINYRLDALEKKKKENSSDIRPRRNYAAVFYTLNENNIC